MRPTDRVAWLFLLNAYYGHHDTPRLPFMVRLLADPPCVRLADPMINDLQQRLCLLGHAAKQVGLEVGNPTGSVTLRRRRCVLPLQGRRGKTKRLRKDPTVGGRPPASESKLTTDGVLHAPGRLPGGEGPRLAAGPLARRHRLL